MPATVHWPRIAVVADGTTVALVNEGESAVTIDGAKVSLGGSAQLVIGSETVEFSTSPRSTHSKADDDVRLGAMIWSAMGQNERVEEHGSKALPTGESTGITAFTGDGRRRDDLGLVHLSAVLMTAAALVMAL